jgi:hypothetical protein
MLGSIHPKYRKGIDVVSYKTNELQKNTGTPISILINSLKQIRNAKRIRKKLEELC